ncbi:MAG TPA: hypothetical protein VNB06_20145 [Thermoanaerobaculia bacterium]|nr:hypothetical protein [Thermoanaerobaculia bacterium]
MSYEFYKVLHILGVLMLFSGLVGSIVHAANRGDKAQNVLRGALGALHGGGLLLLLIAGFGIIAKLGIGFPGWVWVKLVLWLVFGALIAVPYRKPSWNVALLWLLPVLGTLAAYLAIYKPF